VFGCIGAVASVKRRLSDSLDAHSKGVGVCESVLVSVCLRVCWCLCVLQTSFLDPYSHFVCETQRVLVCVCVCVSFRLYACIFKRCASARERQSVHARACACVRVHVYACVCVLLFVCKVLDRL